MSLENNLDIDEDYLAMLEVFASTYWELSSEERLKRDEYVKSLILRLFFDKNKIRGMCDYYETKKREYRI